MEMNFGLEKDDSDNIISIIDFVNEIDEVILFGSRA